MKKIVISIFALSILISGVVGYGIMKVDNSGFQTINLNPKTKNQFDLLELDLAGMPMNAVYDQFPYKEYVENLDYKNFRLLENNLLQLDTLGFDAFTRQGILSRALTTELADNFINANLDSLYAVLLLADLYFEESVKNKQFELLYSAVGGYWYNAVANKLSKEAEAQSEIKYTFKYRYLDQKCLERSYNVNSGNSKLEKVALYFIDGKWSYIFKRLVYASSWKIKLALILLVGVQVYLIGFFMIKSKKK